MTNQPWHASAADAAHLPTSGSGGGGLGGLSGGGGGGDGEKKGVRPVKASAPMNCVWRVSPQSVLPKRKNRHLVSRGTARLGI